MTCQLYLLTPPRIDAGFADTLCEALDAGEVAALQLRLKDHSVDEIKELAPLLVEAAQSRGVAVIMNDDPELGNALGCDGVHVGQGDVPAKQARAAIGPKRMLGVTCHDSRHLAMQAGEAGADYVAFGAFYPTETKEAATQAEPELLTWWTELFEIPCVAIGGITVDNAEPLIEAGADFLAVSSGVWKHADGPGAAVIAFNHLMRGK